MRLRELLPELPERVPLLLLLDPEEPLDTLPLDLVRLEPEETRPDDLGEEERLGRDILPEELLDRDGLDFLIDLDLVSLPERFTEDFDPDDFFSDERLLLVTAFLLRLSDFCRMVRAGSEDRLVVFGCLLTRLVSVVLIVRFDPETVVCTGNGVPKYLRSEMRSCSVF